MWVYHIKLAFRSLVKNKLVSSINILGLGLGLALSLLVSFYIKHELSYDSWIPQKENIHRLYRLWGEDRGNLYTPGPLAEAIRTEISGVRSACLIGVNQDMLLEKEGNFFSVPEMLSADKNFLKTIPLPLALGDPQTAFSQPNSALISHNLAKLIFGEENPLGASLILESSMPITIGGVLAPFEGPSHIKADLIVHEEVEGGYWSGGLGYTYVQTYPNTNLDDIALSIKALYDRHLEQEYLADGEDFDKTRLPKWGLQNISAIHLNSNKLGESGEANGSYQQIGIIALLGTLVLFLAIINYINLSTARLRKKAPAVGVRKVIGASTRKLIQLFLVESLISVAIAILVGLSAIYLAIPYFNSIISRSLQFQDFFDAQGFTIILALLGIVSLLTGIFPSLFYSRLHPIQSINGKISGVKESARFRNGLVVTQFALSIGLLLFVSLVWHQVQFMLHKDLGFQGDQILIVRLNQEESISKYYSKKDQILKIPGVEASSLNSRTPGDFIPNYRFFLEGAEKAINEYTLFGDEDWNKNFEIPIKAGRYFSTDYGQDSTSSFVVNEAFVEKYNLENPIGKGLSFGADEPQGQIVGVIENFHFQSLEQKIEPLIISARMDKAWMGSVLIRINPSNISASLSAINEIWKEMEPDFPVTSFFLNDQFSSLYTQHQRFQKSLLFTAIASIFIALLGLFGLSTFVVAQKTKEIGIRKVLGASISNIITLLSKRLLLLVLIAMLLATPISWYLGQKWLQGFAFTVSFPWKYFILIGCSSLALAWLTISYQSIQAALSNPAETLKDE